MNQGRLAGSTRTENPHLIADDREYGAVDAAAAHLKQALSQFGLELVVLVSNGKGWGGLSEAIDQFLEGSQP